MDSRDDIPHATATDTYNSTIKKMLAGAPKTQADKFKEAAREVETDDREEAFDAIVKKIAKAPPPKDDKPPKKAAG